MSTRLNMNQIQGLTGSFSDLENEISIEESRINNILDGSTIDLDSFGEASAEISTLKSSVYSIFQSATSSMDSFYEVYNSIQSLENKIDQINLGAQGPTGPQGATGSGSTFGSFGITVDGSGSVITTGNKGYSVLPYDGTITGWQIIADKVGSCVIDVWKASSGNIPTSANSITGSEKPTISSQQINSDLSLSTWSTSITQNDVICFNVDSASLVTRVNLIIFITKS